MVKSIKEKLIRMIRDILRTIFWTIIHVFLFLEWPDKNKRKEYREKGFLCIVLEGENKMKEEELRKHTTCNLCNKKIGHTRLSLFYRVSIERFGIKMDAVKRQSGLEMFLGSVQIAQAMGENEDMAESVMDKLVLTICETCACENRQCIAQMANEKASEK